MSIIGQMYIVAGAICGFSFAVGLLLALVDRLMVRRGWVR